MLSALKLNDIEQEHLQDVYNATGIPREELPYSEAYTKLCQDFQDRVFKNAGPEQVFGALLKYGRAGSFQANQVAHASVTPDLSKILKTTVRKHGKAGKVLPYSSEFDSALAEFNKVSGLNLSARDFWLSICKSQAKPRALPPRKKVKKEVEEEEDGE